MAKGKPSIETSFLRAFAAHYVSEISFANSVLDAMERLDIGIADVLHVLRNGQVVNSEKNEAEGATWYVAGENCDGMMINLRLHVRTDCYSVRVLRLFAS